MPGGRRVFCSLTKLLSRSGSYKGLCFTHNRLRSLRGAGPARFTLGPPLIAALDFATAPPCVGPAPRRERDNRLQALERTRNLVCVKHRPLLRLLLSPPPRRGASSLDWAKHSLIRKRRTIQPQTHRLESRALLLCTAQGKAECRPQATTHPTAHLHKVSNKLITPEPLIRTDYQLGVYQLYQGSKRRPNQLRTLIHYNNKK